MATRAAAGATGTAEAAGGPRPRCGRPRHGGSPHTRTPGGAVAAPATPGEAPPGTGAAAARATERAGRRRTTGGRSGPTRPTRPQLGRTVGVGQGRSPVRPAGPAAAATPPSPRIRAAARRAAASSTSSAAAAKWAAMSAAVNFSPSALSWTTGVNASGAAATRMSKEESGNAIDADGARRTTSTLSDPGTSALSAPSLATVSATAVLSPSAGAAARPTPAAAAAVWWSGGSPGRRRPRRRAEATAAPLAVPRLQWPFDGKSSRLEWTRGIPVADQSPPIQACLPWAPRTACSVRTNPQTATPTATKRCMRMASQLRPLPSPPAQHQRHLTLARAALPLPVQQPTAAAAEAVVVAEMSRTPHGCLVPAWARWRVEALPHAPQAAAQPALRRWHPQRCRRGLRRGWRHPRHRGAVLSRTQGADRRCSWKASALPSLWRGGGARDTEKVRPFSEE
mmetsp:Transcript_91494/g.296115  ORF Transcript_91494/g.296115 Transcript_91494/m.296115 type:complete len:453 (-) Transcript_91494:238-1596(-)